MELYFKSVKELSDALNKGEISAQELAAAVIDRTKSIDDKLQAFISYDEEYTQNQAAQADKRRKDGKTMGVLDGIPVGLKDNMADKNMPLTCASKILEKFVSPYTDRKSVV